MNDEKDYLERNRRSWDARLPIHLSSAFYDVEGWKSSGRISLTDIERREVGEVKESRCCTCNAILGRIRSHGRAWERGYADATSLLRL